MLQKILLLSVICLSFLDVPAQGINRMYVNGNIGMPNHTDSGLTIQFLNHFAVACYLTHSRLDTDSYFQKRHVLHYKAGDIIPIFDAAQFLGGWVTHNEGFLHFSLMAGPLKMSAFKEQELSPNEIKYGGSHTEWGFTTRADMNITLFPWFGLNLGVMYLRNPMLSIGFINMGINIGMVDDAYSKRWNRTRKPAADKDVPGPNVVY